MDSEPTSEAARTPEHETVVAPTAAARRRSQRWRIVALVALFVGSLVAAKLSGLTDHASVESVRAFMQSMGVGGFLAFLLVFAVGVLLHVPGLVFVGAAVVAYGELLGAGAAYVGAVVSVSASFVIVRAVGGQPLGDVRRPWMRKVLERLERHPVRTIALLRVMFMVAPAINYGMAMTSVRLRDYVVGSAIGLVVPIAVVAFFFDLLVTHVF